MKRIVSLVLALSMVLSMFTFSFAGSTLPDVEGTDYEAAVSALVELGIVNGYEDGTYKADRTVSRAEMAKFLVVSAGLEPAADVSKGATKFSDVAANHWATGYINVATEYGYINGYPEGTFAPDATVSYAEAVTMAIRVLGYKSVVESKGTWPTNYIAKAQELKVLEDVEYGKYTDGATRGNVALLMWNMLTTAMWDVTGENESNGLNFSNANGVTMIDKYFEDYSYIDEEEEVVVTGVTVADGKVTVSLMSEKTTLNSEGNVVPVYANTLELAKDVDFLNVYGRTVSVLFNDEAEEVVMLIPSNKDKVVEGYKAQVLEKDYTLPTGANYLVWGSGETSGDVLNTTYTVNTLDKAKALDYTIAYNIAGDVVEETKEGKAGIRVTCVDSATAYTIDAEAIVLIDGEWATAKDIEKGDVISELVAGELYVINREVVEGEFEDLETKTNLEGSIANITVDGEEYDYLYSSTTTVVEVDEDGEYVAETLLSDILTADKDDDEFKFYGKEVRLFLNYLGEVVRVEFNEISEETRGNFYVATNCPEAFWTVTDKNGTTVYVELNGESYEVKSTVSGDAVDTLVSGEVLLVEFDSKDRVKEIIRVSKDAMSEDFVFDAVVSGENGEILDDYNYVSGEKDTYKVTSNTVVYTITPVEDEEDDTIIDHFEVEMTKGAAALEGVESALVAKESGDNFDKAAFVFVWEEAKNTEKNIGIVEDMGVKSGVENTTISGTNYKYDSEESESFNVNDLVRFTENEGEIKVTAVYSVAFVDANSGDANVVAKVEDRVATMKDGSTKVDLDTKDEAYEDAKIFLVTMTLDKDYNNIFDSVEEVSYEAMKLRADDILVEDLGNDTVLVIRGYEF